MTRTLFRCLVVLRAYKLSQTARSEILVEIFSSCKSVVKFGIYCFDTASISGAATTLGVLVQIPVGAFALGNRLVTGLEYNIILYLSLSVLGNLPGIILGFRDTRVAMS